MGFKFKLEPLHKYKKQMVDLEQQKFAQLTQRLVQIDREIETITDQLKKHIDQNSQMNTPNDSTGLSYVSNIQSLQQRESQMRVIHTGLKELREQKALVLREFNQQKEILNTAHKERKMMDKSKEKALVAFQESLQRKAEKMLNEQSIQRYQRA
jgi:flagellar export protein FliJ